MLFLAFSQLLVQIVSLSINIKRKLQGGLKIWILHHLLHLFVKDCFCMYSTCTVSSFQVWLKCTTFSSFHVSKFSSFMGVYYSKVKSISLCTCVVRVSSMWLTLTHISRWRAPLFLSKCWPTSQPNQTAWNNKEKHDKVLVTKVHCSMTSLFVAIPYSLLQC